MKYHKHIGFVIALVLVFVSDGQAQSKSTEMERARSDSERPNILWIVADDLGADLGCYGDTLVHTPNLDRFAGEGTLYTNMYTVTAVCSPSRSALITGMYPVSIDCHQHRTQYKRALPEPVRPVTNYFRSAGYFVTNGAFNDLSKPGKRDYNFIHHPDSLYDGTDWRQRKDGQPFFSQIQVFYPHRPFKRDHSNPVNPDLVKLPPYYPDHPIARQDWALYLETIQIVDREVGEILQRLEQDGLAENTVVFFFGDQGRPHVRCKQFLYDGGTHTPLLIRWPGKLKPGTRDSQLISNIDLPATAMRLAGIEIPEYMQGRDFLTGGKRKREHVFSMRDRRDETVDRIRSVRNANYKYIRNFYPERPYTQFNAYKKQSYPMLPLMQVMHKDGRLTPAQEHFMKDHRPEEELYDLRSDPHEIHNLAIDPAYQKEKEKLSDVLDEWLSIADKGKYPEDPAEIRYAKELMKENYKRGMEKIGLTAESSDEEILEYWEQVLTPTKMKDDK